MVIDSDHQRVQGWKVPTGQPLFTWSLDGILIGFDRDSRRLIVQTHDGKIELLDTESGQSSAAPNPLSNSDGITYYLRASSPQQQWVAAEFADNGDMQDIDTNIISASTGQLRVTLEGQMVDLAFSPDDQHLAFIDGETLTVQMWDAMTNRIRTVIRDYDLPVNVVTFTADGTHLVAGGGYDPDHDFSDPRGMVRSWEVLTHNPPQVTLIPGYVIANLSLDPTGTLLAVAPTWLRGGYISLRDAKTGHQLQTFLNNGNSHIGSVRFSPDGTRLAFAEDNTIEIYAPSTSDWLMTLNGHTGTVGPMVFSPDGQILTSASADGTVRRWDVATGQQIAILDAVGDSSCIAFNPAGTLVATQSKDRFSLEVWQVSTNTLRQRILIADPTPTSPTRQSPCILALSPDGRLLVMQYHMDPHGYLDSIQVLDTMTGEIVKQIQTDFYNGTPTAFLDFTKAVAFNPDGTLLAYADAGGVVQLWAVQ